ncbi:MAG: NADH-quinone oxidoreductase subunit NuoH [Bacteriovoracaceae bacterium]|nr:NADH-quinone oxidoreductase subunit NuoH [Bacteriovoracaceae bacterium]
MNQTIVSYLAQYEFFDFLIKIFGENSLLLTTLIFAIAAGVFVAVAATIGGLGTYAERKISADIQMRLGPNRVGPYGLLQFLADGVKMITKEDVMPNSADKFLFYLAPMLCLVGVFATLAVLPISSGFTLVDLNVGVFYLIAISSLVGLGVFLGGYASNSKWSMLGGMRGASQIISYEIPVTLSVLAITLTAGSMSFGNIVSQQEGFITNWFIFHNPFSFLAFFIYFVGAMAETNRAPFDLPEAESELVSGYHTEYTGMRFGFFALAEYIEVFVVSGVAAALFLGGYNLPVHVSIDILPIQFIQVTILVGKALALYYVIIWVRWTFPRLRVDHLMSICWKYLTPIAIFNLIGSAIWMVAFRGQSIVQILGH